MLTGSALLNRIVQRIPMNGHDGRSGAQLERVVLDDGTRLVLKHIDLALDLGAYLTGDQVVREAALWEAGLLHRFPRGVGHPVVEVVRGEVTTVVMHDLGDTVFGWHDHVTLPEIRRIVRAMTAVHNSFRGIDLLWLCDLTVLLGVFHPDRMTRASDHTDNRLSASALRGWEALADLLPGDLFSIIERTAADPAPLARSLATGGVTLLHADLWPVNIAMQPDRVVFLDWALATAGPAALDFTCFLWAVSGQGEAPPGALLDVFLGDQRTTDDLVSLDRSLFATMVLYGWDKAAAVVKARSEASRARRLADLTWWVSSARNVLESGSIA